MLLNKYDILFNVVFVSNLRIPFVDKIISEVPKTFKFSLADCSRDYNIIILPITVIRRPQSFVQSYTNNLYICLYIYNNITCLFFQDFLN